MIVVQGGGLPISDLPSVSCLQATVASSEPHVFEQSVFQTPLTQMYKIPVSFFNSNSPFRHVADFAAGIQNEFK